MFVSQSLLYSNILTVFHGLTGNNIRTLGKIPARIDKNIKSSTKLTEFVTDPRNNAKWQTDILELEMTSEIHFGLGAAYRCVNRFMGEHIESEGVITDKKGHAKIEVYS